MSHYHHKFLLSASRLLLSAPNWHALSRLSPTSRQPCISAQHGIRSSGRSRDGRQTWHSWSRHTSASSAWASSRSPAWSRPRETSSSTGQTMPSPLLRNTTSRSCSGHQVPLRQRGLHRSFGPALKSLLGGGTIVFGADLVIELPADDIGVVTVAFGDIAAELAISGVYEAACCRLPCSARRPSASMRRVSGYRPHRRRREHSDRVRPQRRHLVLGQRSGMKDTDNSLQMKRGPGALVDLLGGRVEQFYAIDFDAHPEEVVPLKASGARLPRRSGLSNSPRAHRTPSPDALRQIERLT